MCCPKIVNSANREAMDLADRITCGKKLSGNVAFLGGSFDPPHNGHVALGEISRLFLANDEFCIVMPTAKNPLKIQSDIPPASAAHRLAMARLAFPENRNFLVSDYESKAPEFRAPGEIQAPRPNFTVDTVRVLRARNPAIAQLFLIIGQDNAANFSRWREHETLLEMVTPVVVSRNGSVELDPLLKPEQRSWFKIFRDLQIKVSSSAIRQRVFAGLAPTEIPQSVSDYIGKQHLYRP